MAALTRGLRYNLGLASPKETPPSWVQGLAYATAADRMSDLLAICELGIDGGPDAEFPSFNLAGDPLLGETERGLWRGSANNVSCARLRGSSAEHLWTFPDTARLTMTNMRFILSCPKFTKGAKMWGFGVVGLAVALTHNAVTASQAASERQGKTAAGHVRFDWPFAVVLTAPWALDWTSLSLLWSDENSPLILNVPLGAPHSRRIAELLVVTMARDRLATSDLLVLEKRELALLRQQAFRPVECGMTDGVGYEIPAFLPQPLVAERSARTEMHESEPQIISGDAFGDEVPVRSGECPACGSALRWASWWCAQCGGELTDLLLRNPPPFPHQDWYRDPSGRHPDRWWDGAQWTKWVRDQPGGTRSEDPPFKRIAQRDGLASLPLGSGEGWYSDPSGRHPDRWWDGIQWTKWVRDRPGGTRSEDPLDAATPSDAGAVSTPAGHGAAPTPPVVADELRKLADLRDAGVLTDEEFALQKARLLEWTYRSSHD